MSIFNVFIFYEQLGTIGVRSNSIKSLKTLVRWFKFLVYLWNNGKNILLRFQKKQKFLNIKSAANLRLTTIVCLSELLSFTFLWMMWSLFFYKIGIGQWFMDQPYNFLSGLRIKFLNNKKYHKTFSFLTLFNSGKLRK